MCICAVMCVSLSVYLGAPRCVGDSVCVPLSVSRCITYAGFGVSLSLCISPVPLSLSRGADPFVSLVDRRIVGTAAGISIQIACVVGIIVGRGHTAQLPCICPHCQISTLRTLHDICPVWFPCNQIMAVAQTRHPEPREKHNNCPRVWGSRNRISMVNHLYGVKEHGQ